jgi:tetratricopeptide (TPR) repeat protein
MVYPFEYVSKGLALLETGKFFEAEKFIMKGVSEYEKVNDKGGVEYALGRLGFCYEKSGFMDKAQKTYEKAVNLGTNIPATYSNLIPILTFKGDLDRAFEIADLYQFRCLGNLQNTAHELFIHLSSRLIREGKKEAALTLLSRTINYFPKDSQPSSFWQIRGLIGFAFEKSGDLEEAMKLYRQAIDEGSVDHNTYQRYLINLEKNKEFSTAVKFTEKALKVQKDVAWKADLEKRLLRLKQKTGQISKSASKQIVEDFLIKRGKNNLSLVKQILFTPQLSRLVVSNNFFYGVTGGKTPKLFCYSVETHDRVWETALDGDPGGLTLIDNHLIASTSEGKIGQGITKLLFFNVDGKLIAAQTLPDLLSETAACSGRLYAGCRNGKLYAFSKEGAPLWSYTLEDYRHQSDEKYSRPCPYYVSAGKEIVAFSSYSTLYVLDTTGKMLYQWNVPYLNETVNGKGFQVTFSMTGGPISDLRVFFDSKKILISSHSTIFEIKDGKITNKINTSPENINNIQILDDDSIGACGFEQALIIKDGKIKKKIPVTGICELTSNLNANRLAIWFSNQLKVLTYSGVLISEVEFVKNIHNVHIFDNGIMLVATRYAILFDSALKKPDSPKLDDSSNPFVEDKTDKTIQPQLLENVRPKNEDGFSIRWLEERKISLGQGKAFYLGVDGHELTIEQIALHNYLKEGFVGGWTENNYWWEIMALLFWDVIFAKIPGTFTPHFGEFPSERQDIPIDFFTLNFYLRRRKLIERRFQELNSTKLFGLVKKTFDSELRDSHKKNYGKPCRPIEDWNKYPLELLSLATQNLQKDQMNLILQRLLENFIENRKGLPDLFLINSAGKPLFVEVKAENEKIADHQKSWHQFIKKVTQIDVEICRVIDI